MTNYQSVSNTTSFKTRLAKTDPLSQISYIIYFVDRINKTIILYMLGFRKI